MKRFLFKISSLIFIVGFLVACNKQKENIFDKLNKTYKKDFKIEEKTLNLTYSIEKNQYKDKTVDLSEEDSKKVKDFFYKNDFTILKYGYKMRYDNYIKVNDKMLIYFTLPKENDPKDKTSFYITDSAENYTFTYWFEIQGSANEFYDVIKKYTK